MSGQEFDERTQRELQQMLEVEQQKAKFQGMIHTFTDMCWEKCIDKPGAKLSRGEESCMTNCVDRFLDTSYFIVARLDKLKKDM